MIALGSTYHKVTPNLRSTTVGELGNPLTRMAHFLLQLSWLLTKYANGKFRDRFARHQKLQDPGASQGPFSPPISCFVRFLNIPALTLALNKHRQLNYCLKKRENA